MKGKIYIKMVRKRDIENKKNKMFNRKRREKYYTSNLEKGVHV